MIVQRYKEMLGHESVIRQIFMYGKKRAAEIGYENVFDYSLGNPSVPCPEAFTKAMERLLAESEPVALHGYCPNQGDPTFRRAVAESCARRFGLPYEVKHIFPTTGAAGALSHAMRAVVEPGKTVLTFAPYFSEYGPYVEGLDAHLGVVPADTTTFQPNFEELEKRLTPDVAAVLINTPNNPSGVAYSCASMEKLGEILRKKSAEYGHTVFLISDEPLPGRRASLPGRVLRPYPHLLLLLQEHVPARRAHRLCGGQPRRRRRGLPGGYDGPDQPRHRPQLPLQHHPAGLRRVHRLHQRSVGLRDQHEPDLQ